MNNIKLYLLNRDLKHFIALFVSVLTIGVIIGLFYLFNTTQFSKANIEQRYSSEIQSVDEDFGIPDKNGKSLSEVLMTAHNHIISFSIFFFITGLLFYFTSTIDGKLKKIIFFEPMISILLSFGSILGIHFFSKEFIYITILSATLMYFFFFTMIVIILFELLIKNNS
jgi:hypothetical protein